LNNLPAGSYELHIYDEAGCFESYSNVVSEPSIALTSTLNKINDVDCYGDSTGQVQVIVSGGVPAYSYIWDDIAVSSPIISDLAAGLHTVWITDDWGCTIMDTITIYENPLIQDSITIIQNVSCHGGSDGAVSIISTGGILSHSYDWSNGHQGISQPDTNTGLFFGSYYVIVEDQLGCRVVDSVFISEPDVLQTEAIKVAHVTCFGFDNGIATAIGIGGTTPYTFVWDSIQTGDTAFNLTPGVHTVVVTDAKGCIATDTVVITQPYELIVNIIDSLTILPYCTGVNSASLTAVASGGTPGYTYVWDDNNILPQTTTTATALFAGVYTITATDSRGCIATDTEDIDTITATMDAIIDTQLYNGNVNVSCFGANDGMAIVSTWGAHAPYTYQWFGPNNYTATNDSIDDLFAGTYSVTINDTNNCSINRSINLTQPDALQFTTFSATDETCLGAANGTVSIDIQGGSSPYTGIATDNNSGIITTHLIQNDSIVTGITSGVFTITVTDANNCQSTLQIGGVNQQSITTGITVSSQIQNTNLPQFGGPIDTSTAGGEFSNYNGHLILDCTSPSKLVSAVVYAEITNSITFELRDNGGAVLDDTTITVQPGKQRLYFDFDIPVGSDLELGISTGNSRLYRNNAGSGTMTGYPFSINGDVIIHDAYFSNQYYYFYYDLEVVTPLSVPCFNSSGASLFVQNTDSNFSYSWQEINSPGVTVATGNQANNLYAGTYILLAGYTDSLGVTYTGCTDTSQSVTIVQPNAINISAILDAADCYGENSGSINTTVSGGTPSFTYSWSPGGQNSPDLNNILAGTYIVNITDANGCIQSDTFAISEPLNLISTDSSSDYNGYGVSCFGGSDGTLSISVDQNTGTAPFTYSWSPGGQTALNISNLSAGQYVVTVTDANGCNYQNTVDLIAPPILSLSTVVTSNYNGADISCNGIDDGSASVTSSGGVQPHDILWNNSSTSQNISNLSAGTYSVTITDKNGCAQSAVVTLNDPAALSVGLNIRDSLSYNVSCFGICDGWAEAIPSGGTVISGNYTYTWSNGQTNSLVDNLCAGTSYTVTVTDANGCEVSSTTITFTQPPAFEATVATTNYYGPEKPPLNIHFTDSTYLSTIHPMLFTWLWPDGGIEPLSWEFGDPGMNISYSFTDIGENKVNLIVLNKTTGCTDTIDFVIDVQGLGEINNVFSPNGDEVNDVFVFENHGMDILSVMIFNRWGQKVFETDVSSAQWDGKNLKGNDELAGTYFYVLTAQGEDGYRYDEKGAVILIRE
jgi:gliding motility-associated-like protein